MKLPVAVRIKVDEDLPGEVAELLRGAGHDALTVAQQHLSGAPDEALWDSVQREGRCFITADKGFADARLHPPGTHGGIVLFRLPRESREAYIELARTLLENLALDTIVGAIVWASPDAVRIHRPE